MHFGTAGIPISTNPHNTEQGILQISKLSLSALELEFVYGVNLTSAKAISLKPIAEENKILLSVHAPYYINLNSQDSKKIHSSISRILQSAQIASYLGARKVVFHPAFMHSSTEKEVTEKVVSSLQLLLEKMKEKKIKTQLAPETTGKSSQFGSLSHLLSLCDSLPELSLTIDFSHLHAREKGKFKNKKDFTDIFSSLPKKILNDIHIHTSGIVYTDKGEKNHVTLESKENTFPYKPFVQALKESKAKGTLICESPNLEKDALLLQSYYNSL